MKSKPVLILAGFVMIVLWIFIEATGMTFILIGLLFTGIFAFLTVIAFIIHPTDRSSWNQYVEHHNRNAELMKRIEVENLRAEQKRESSSQEALIDESDD